MMSTYRIWRYILIGFAITLLICGVNNFLIIVLRDSTWCQWLCPPVFGKQTIGDIPGFNLIFLTQEWLQSNSQQIVERILFDQFNVATTLIIAPIVEEMIYRGPMYLTRRYSNHTSWWLIGIALTVVFALSHDTSGIAWLPLLFLGSYGLWLIAKTERFWPAIALHMLYNFFILSLILRQTMWMSD